MLLRQRALLVVRQVWLLELQEPQVVTISSLVLGETQSVWFLRAKAVRVYRLVWVRYSRPHHWGCLFPAWVLEWAVMEVRAVQRACEAGALP